MRKIVLDYALTGSTELRKEVLNKLLRLFELDEKTLDMIKEAIKTKTITFGASDVKNVERLVRTLYRVVDPSEALISSIIAYNPVDGTLNRVELRLEIVKPVSEIMLNIENVLKLYEAVQLFQASYILSRFRSPTTEIKLSDDIPKYLSMLAENALSKTIEKFINHKLMCIEQASYFTYRSLVNKMMTSLASVGGEVLLISQAMSIPRKVSRGDLTVLDTALKEISDGRLVNSILCMTVSKELEPQLLSILRSTAQEIVRSKLDQGMAMSLKELHSVVCRAFVEEEKIYNCDYILENVVGTAPQDLREFTELGYTLMRSLRKFEALLYGTYSRDLIAKMRGLKSYEERLLITTIIHAIFMNTYIEFLRSPYELSPVLIDLVNRIMNTLVENRHVLPHEDTKLADLASYYVESFKMSKSAGNIVDSKVLLKTLIETLAEVTRFLNIKVDEANIREVLGETSIYTRYSYASTGEKIHIVLNPRAIVSVYDGLIRRCLGIARSDDIPFVRRVIGEDLQICSWIEKERDLLVKEGLEIKLFYC